MRPPVIKVGQRFNKLVVLREFEDKSTRGRKWVCKCDCGREIILLTEELSAHKRKSCGCYRVEAVQKYNEKIRNSISNQRFGKLLVISPGLTIQGKRQPIFSWICKCDCGNTITIKASLLREGYVRSCGCIWKDSSVREASPDLIFFRPVIARRSGCKENPMEVCLDYLKKLWESQKGICPYSGISLLLPEWKAFESHPRRASLDRIDASKGYIEGNIQFVSILANYAKNQNTHEEMVNFCKQIAKFWKDRI